MPKHATFVEEHEIGTTEDTAFSSARLTWRPHSQALEPRPRPMHRTVEKCWIRPCSGASRSVRSEESLEIMTTGAQSRGRRRGFRAVRAAVCRRPRTLQ